MKFFNLAFSAAILITILLIFSAIGKMEDRIISRVKYEMTQEFHEIMKEEATTTVVVKSKEVSEVYPGFSTCLYTVTDGFSNYWYVCSLDYPIGKMIDVKEKKLRRL